MENKTLNDTLGISNLDPVNIGTDLPAITEPLEGELVEAEIIDPHDTIDEDFDKARSVITDVLDKSQAALDGIIDLATLSQNPRSFEVVATLINSVTSASKDLLELSKKRQEIKNAQGTPTTNGGKNVNTINQQNVFVGNTTDLLKMIKEQKD